MDIAVSGHKGGVGKTTTTLHLAYYLARARPEETVLVVDYDSKNKSALRHQDRAATNQIALPFKVVDGAEATRHIRQADHVLLDLPGSPEENKLSKIAEGVDLMVLPSGITDAANTEPILDVLEDLDGKAYRILVTMAPPRPQMDGERLQAFYKDAGAKVFETVVRFAKTYNHASNTGTLVTKGHYDAVMDEILAIMGVEYVTR